MNSHVFCPSFQHIISSGGFVAQIVVQTIQLSSSTQHGNSSSGHPFATFQRWHNFFGLETTASWPKVSSLGTSGHGWRTKKELPMNSLITKNNSNYLRASYLKNVTSIMLNRQQSCLPQLLVRCQVWNILNKCTKTKHVRMFYHYQDYFARIIYEENN